MTKDVSITFVWTAMTRNAISRRMYSCIWGPYPEATMSTLVIRYLCLKYRDTVTQLRLEIEYRRNYFQTESDFLSYMSAKVEISINSSNIRKLIAKLLLYFIKPLDFSFVSQKPVLVLLWIFPNEFRRQFVFTIFYFY